MLNYIKYNIYSISLISGTFLACSSSSWFTVWLGLEINLMSLIPLLVNNLNPQSSETSIKYFIAQAMASIILILSSLILIFKNSMNTMNFTHILLITAFSIKMGAAPMHFWLPQVIKSAQWMQVIIILTWQKIAPMMMMMFIKNNLIKYLVMISCLVGVMGAINQSLIKSILVYSSILHTGWLLASLTCSENIWFVYFILYSIISISVILPLMMSSFETIKEMYFTQTNILLSATLFLNLLSMAGIPPLLGFGMKMMTIIAIVNLNLDLGLITLMIMCSLISLFYYLRIMYSSMFLSAKKNKTHPQKTFNNWLNSLFLKLSIMGNLLLPMIFVCL